MDDDNVCTCKITFSVSGLVTLSTKIRLNHYVLICSHINAYFM